MVTYRNGPSAIQAYRQLLVRDSHLPVICAVGARVRFAFFTFSCIYETKLMFEGGVGGSDVHEKVKNEIGRAHV